MDILSQGLSITALQHLSAAGDYLEMGKSEQAEQTLKFAAIESPDHPEVLRVQAGLMSLKGHHIDAIRTMQKSIKKQPQNALYHNTMGTLLGAAGDYELATKALRNACELQPDLAIAWFNLGIMLTRRVYNDQAISALERAIELDPKHWNSRALLADMLRTQGRINEARSQYHQLLAERPCTGTAWWGLAELRDAPFSAADLSRMAEASKDAEATVEDLIAIRFTMARAMEDLGKYTESLQCLSQANAMARGRQAWDADQFADASDEINKVFMAPVIGANKDLGKEVIFITSLPRSGSTLVEQILASHSAVEGAGELPDLPLVLNEESRRRGMAFPQWVPAMLPEDWERLGNRYLARTARWRVNRPVFTDKLLNNWMYIGAIRAMLPSARIVASRRDAVETCFSCYRQHMTNNEYTRSYEDLAKFWHLFDRSVTASVHAHPDNVFDHRYESLLADPEFQIRRLLAFCGLPFESACVNFHKTDREIRSPSATQVRQPLHDTSRSSRYGNLLDPLRNALDIQARRLESSVRSNR